MTMGLPCPALFCIGHNSSQRCIGFMAGCLLRPMTLMKR